MASLLQKCLGMFPSGASEMINWPHAPIIWGWHLHQHYANWVLFYSQKNHSTEAWRLDLLCLGKPETRYRKMSLWDFQAEVWADPKKSAAWTGKALAVLAAIVPRGLPQSRSHLHRDSHHFCPPGNVCNNLLPWDSDGEAWSWPHITYRCLYIWRSICVVVMSAMPNPAKCPVLTVFSIIPQVVLAQMIYNISLHTVDEFSSQLVRIGNNSPKVNIKVACQEVWKNTHEKKAVSCCVMIICSYNRNASVLQKKLRTNTKDRLLPNLSKIQRPNSAPSLSE